MVFVVETEEIKENQDALEDLLRYCKTPEKWITAILLAYSVRVVIFIESVFMKEIKY